MNPFFNPLINKACELVDLDDLPDILMIEYSEGKCYAFLYDVKGESVTSPYKKVRIELDSLSRLLMEFLRSGDMAYPDVVGTDKKSFYDSITHREALYIRVFFPACLLQVDYEDESQNLSFEDIACDSLRDEFKTWEND